MNVFFIDIFNDTVRVDIDRCRLYRDGQVIPLEPKVIQVLHVLARHPGEVVTHKTLLDAIWTHTIVEPGALQRCIAQLRKAFRDDARQQRIIATYPKRGYSLVAQVRWQPPVPQAVVDNHSRFRPTPVYAAAAALLLAVVLVAGFITGVPEPDGTAQPPPAPVAAGSLLSNPALLAASAEPDDFPVYSPDGRYVVYPRYLVDRKANLWARDLAYGNDFLLTDEAGQYEYLAWSRDGSQLVFVDSTCQEDGCAAGACSSLKSVTLSQSETNALDVQTLIDCSPRRLLAPEWLGAGALAVVELEARQASLVRYDLRTRERAPLFQSSELLPYHLSFSRQTGTLTIMAVTPAGRKELLFLDINTGTVNRNDTAVFVPDENWYPSSSPL